MATRRTRIVCISDTHNQTPKLPSGDILIHAGDVTNQGSYSELQKMVDWIKRAKFRVKIVIAGNHDITLDKDFYTQHGQYFHNKAPEDSQQCIDLFSRDPDITYLIHEAKQIQLTFDDGAVATLNVFGSPYSPTHRLWGFGYTPETASKLWNQIPLDTDIVVAHTPAKFHLDKCSSRGNAAGCDALRQSLWRVRPRLFLCGHIHEGYGVEVVDWDLSSLNVKYKEAGVRQYSDPEPHSKKQFTVDLSARTRSLALQNDGGVDTSISPLSSAGSEHEELYRAERPCLASNGHVVDSAMSGAHKEHDSYSGRATLPTMAPSATSPFPDYDKATPPASSVSVDSPIADRGSWGQGGPASSGRCDREAIAGREGRRQTCFVNAAFMASSFPHDGGKRFHKPIVLDLDLPITHPFLSG